MTVPEPIARRRGRARKAVVDEHHAMPHEHLVLDDDAVTHERVALDLAVTADHHTMLNLDERADPGVVADAAAVKVRERVDEHVRAKLDLGDKPIWRVVRRLRRHAGSTLSPSP
jgi:hypothetical protein